VDSGITVQLKHPRWKSLLRPYCKTVRAACEAALPQLAVGSWQLAEITVVLANDDLIRDLNKTYRGKNKPTNVLAFPGIVQKDPNLPTANCQLPTGGTSRHLGDLVLALETIEREAKEQGKTFKDHAKHLLVHGTLHLLGYDHMKKREAQEMEALEIKILKKLGVANPYV